MNILVHTSIMKKSEESYVQTLACLTKHLDGRTGSTLESFKVMFVALLTNSPSAISQTAYSFCNVNNMYIHFLCILLQL